MLIEIFFKVLDMDFYEFTFSIGDFLLDTLLIIKEIYHLIHVLSFPPISIIFYALIFKHLQEFEDLS